MANDINLIDSGNPIHNGYAVIGENTINYYQSVATASGVIDDSVLQKPVIADIQDKYDDKFDDKAYYVT